MQIGIDGATHLLIARLTAANFHDAEDTAWATIWLEACGYTGLTFLREALSDEQKSLELRRDALGLDLHNVSCAWLAPGIMRHVEAQGRVFLRNVRHGLFLLPFTVRHNIGIGCPVDPAFAVGGERHKNPYAEKLTMAEAQGLTIDDTLWNMITAH